MAESFANNVGRQKSWKDVSRRIFRKNFWIKTQTRTYCNLIYIFKKRFFKSAENFRYGKSSKLNMLAFRKKKSKNSPMGMKIHFQIQKIDQILPDF